MDMIKSLSKARRSAQSLLRLQAHQENSLVESTNEGTTAELDWSALQSAVNIDSLVFDGIHSLFEQGGGSDDASLYHLAM